MVRRVVEEERITRPDVYVADTTSGPAIGMGILVGVLLVAVAVFAVLLATGTFSGTKHYNPAPTVSNGGGGNVSQAPQAPLSQAPPAPVGST